MNLAIVGTGYVGLVTGACLAELGNFVHCIDTNPEKIAQLQAGIMPIYEPRLETIVIRNAAAGRLRFATDLAAILPHVDLVMIAVGTPPLPDGAADLRAVEQVATTIGDHLCRYVLVVNKSTVPVGTAHRVHAIIEQRLQARGVHVEFDVASNPEFLKEGDAVNDFMAPDRVVVGVDSQPARSIMTALYRPMLLSNFRVIFMDIRSAELTKYASNAMLATRISFMNEMANLCERVGADITAVRLGMGGDPRIGGKFLYAGCGYGGSCFPKDIAALMHTASQAGSTMQILQAVSRVNQEQKRILFRKFSQYCHGDVKGKHAAVWGLAFKPGTDDMREAPSIDLLEALLEAGCTVSVYDPAAVSEAKRLFGYRIGYAPDPYEATRRADVLFHVTEWKEFRMPDWQRIRKLMRHPLIIDGRNVFDKNLLEGFDYLRIG